VYSHLLLKVQKKKALKLLENNQYIEHKTSFGAEKIRSDPWPKVVNEECTIRIAIGYNDTFENIKKGFDQIINNC